MINKTRQNVSEYVIFKLFSFYPTSIYGSVGTLYSEYKNYIIREYEK